MLVTRTIYRHPVIRILIYPVVLLLTLYALHFAGDLLTPMQTSNADRQMAAEYLAVHNLPEPDREFARDGCTLFPDKLPFHDFNDVCLQHDIAYWAGGSKERQKTVNLEFKQGVVDVGPLGPVLSPVMYASLAYLGNNGVSRVIRSHWGFGWN